MHRAESLPGGCVVVSQSAYDLFRAFASYPRADALLKEIMRDMTPIAALPDITIYRGSRE